MCVSMDFSVNACSFLLWKIRSFFSFDLYAIYLLYVFLSYSIGFLVLEISEQLYHHVKIDVPSERDKQRREHKSPTIHITKIAKNNTKRLRKQCKFNTRLYQYREIPSILGIGTIDSNKALWSCVLFLYVHSSTQTNREEKKPKQSHTRTHTHILTVAYI